MLKKKRRKLSKMAEEKEKQAEIKQDKKPEEKKEELTQAEEIEKLESASQEGEEVKKEKPKKERVGILHIRTTKNNTILMLTDMAGNTLSRASGGMNTKQARLKSSPTIAMFAAKKISEDAKEHGISDLYIRVRAATGEISPSSVSHAVVKALSRDDFRVISIMDITRNARGGPKKKGGRRGRRV